MPSQALFESMQEYVRSPIRRGKYIIDGVPFGGLIGYASLLLLLPNPMQNLDKVANKLFRTHGSIGRQSPAAKPKNVLKDHLFIRTGSKGACLRNAQCRAKISELVSTHPAHAKIKKWLTGDGNAR
jgi:hypothetical protein